MRHLSSAIIFSGLVLIAISVNVIFFTFYPVIWVQLKYTLERPNQNIEVTNSPSVKGNVLRPVDDDFGIVIPKIGANSKIIADVDPYNEKIYQLALTHGVAHAKGTAFPDAPGNMFLFSHSSVNFYEAVRYNSVFYLLSKMEKDDEIYIFFRKQRYIYKVLEKKVVGAGEVKYLDKQSDTRTLTLMTCTPAGTTFKRLIIVAQAQNEQN